MRIVIHDYAGHAFPTQLSRELARRGHEVTHVFGSGLLTPQGDLQLRHGDPASLWFRAVPLHPRYREYKYSFVRRRSIEIQYGRDLVKVIANIRPEVVLSGNMPSEPQAILQRHCREQGIRFVAWIQDFYGIAVDRLVRRKIPLLGRMIGGYYKAVDRRVHREADHVVAITEDFLPLLQADGVARTRVTTIPNWACLADLPVAEQDNAWARLHGLAGKRVVLYSGTLAMKHNPALLRDLAVRTRDDPKVRLVVVSEGPGREWLEEEKKRLALENLLLLPYQPFGELPNVLGSADVLVAVLEADAGVFSVPSKILTYLCAERPIVAAMPAGNLAARILTETGGGVVVDSTDGPAFCGHVCQLLTDAARRRKMGRAARHYAETTFDIATIADRFEGILTGKGVPSATVA